MRLENDDAQPKAGELIRRSEAGAAGTDDRDVMRAVARAQFRPVQLGRPQVPDGVARAVHRLMAPSPASRYPMARDASEALAEAFDAQGGGRSLGELGLLCRKAAAVVEEQTSEFDGPGGRLKGALPGLEDED